MYHKVGSPVRCKADRYINVMPAGFARQVRLLAGLGFQGITFAQLIQGYRTGAGLPPRPICLTFDDAYQSVADHAVPVLEAVGWKATVYVTTSYIGTENGWDRPFGKAMAPIMDWDTVRSLHRLKWEVGAHTRTHPQLEQVSDEVAWDEIAGSRADIEAQIGEPPPTFCYPFGRYGTITPSLVQRAGYIGACTTHKQWATTAHDPYRFPRLGISNGNLPGFVYRLFVRGRYSRDPRKIPLQAPDR